MIAIKIGGSSGAALLLIVDFLEIGVNDLVAAWTTSRTAGTRPAMCPGAALRTATGVAARLTMEAIDAQGNNLTRDGVRQWVENIHDWDTHWGVKLTFHPGPGVGKRSNISCVFMKVINKKFVPQTGIVEAPSFKKAT